MKLVKRHLDNYWDDNDPRSLIFHTTLGHSFAGAYETLKARGLSYNYLIDEDYVYEIVPWNKSAWHAGIKSNPVERITDFYGDTNPNTESVGIAFIRRGEALTENHVNNAVELIKWLGKQTRVAYYDKNTFCHYEVTDYKPKEVKQYRQDVLDALFGEKEPIEFKLKRIFDEFQTDPSPEKLRMLKIVCNVLLRFLRK